MIMCLNRDAVRDTLSGGHVAAYEIRRAGMYIHMIFLFRVLRLNVEGRWPFVSTRGDIVQVLPRTFSSLRGIGLL